ncbi:MAG: DUF1501 domain-containing protein [Candidatus Binatia bacterium]
MSTSRRDFLRTGALGALGLGLLPLERALAAPAPSGDPVVVAVNMFGGNDALNTVVPLRQYARYRELRPVLGLARQRLLPLQGYAQDFALHPGLSAIADLFTQGQVAVINGVGCPPDASGLFDHEASQQNFQTGDTFGTAPSAPPTGWLGRYLDGVLPDALPAGIDFSSAALILTGASFAPLSLYSIQGFGVYPSEDYEARANAYHALHGLAAAPGVPERNRALRQQVVGLGGTLQTISDAYRVAAGVTYPPSYLAGALRDCAALIAADQGVRALAVGTSGFDTHAGQNDAASGVLPYHEALLREVGDAIAAFHADLAGHGLAHRVVTLVFSEFGRRAYENNDLGTDHGFGGTVFAIGNPVKGGVYGDAPDLREAALVLDGNLDVIIDFRRVYATILARHLNADPDRILGASFAPLPFL